MDRGMSRACTSLLNFIRSRPWTPTPDEKEGRTLFDVCHSKRDATCAINPTDGQTFLSTVFDVRPSRRPRFLLATGDTLLLLFRPPPHSHKKYSSLSKLRDPKQFPFRSSERKRKKKTTSRSTFFASPRELSPDDFRFHSWKDERPNRFRASRGKFVSLGRGDVTSKSDFFGSRSSFGIRFSELGCAREERVRRPGIGSEHPPSSAFGGSRRERRGSVDDA